MTNLLMLLRSCIRNKQEQAGVEPNRFNPGKTGETGAPEEFYKWGGTEFLAQVPNMFLCGDAHFYDCAPRHFI
jgi:hypothetical protein